MSLERLESEDRDNAIADRENALGAAPQEVDLMRLVARLKDDAELGGDEAFAEAVGRAWMMGARVVLNTVADRAPCRICGCWEMDACEGGCGWAEPGLCTACAEPLANSDICSVCAKPVEPGSPVRHYDDVGEVHAVCGGATPEQAVDGGRIPVDPDEFSGEGTPPEFVTVYLSGADRR